MSDKPIRVLVTDDSVFMRTMLKNALGKAKDMEVVGSAQNGNEAIDRIKELKPDVMTLDIEMPGLDGIGVLKKVMKDSPMPIVMVSTKTQAGAKLTFEALELGAVDYVAKPLADKDASLQSFQSSVVDAVRAAFSSNRNRLGKQDRLRIAPPRKANIQTEGIVVAIGISAGGPATLHKLIPLLPKEFPPIVLTQHMPADFTATFACRLNDTSQLEVREAASGDVLTSGTLLLAPGSHHLRIAKQGGKLVTRLDDGEKVSGFRPSVDALFKSVAAACNENAIGLVMTGMGFDGAEGIKTLKATGARTLSQDQESCIVYGMPKAAFQTGCVDQVVSLAEIPDVLIRMLSASTASAT